MENISGNTNSGKRLKKQKNLFLIEGSASIRIATTLSKIYVVGFHIQYLHANSRR